MGWVSLDCMGLDWIGLDKMGWDLDGIGLDWVRSKMYGLRHHETLSIVSIYLLYVNVPSLFLGKKVGKKEKAGNMKIEIVRSREKSNFHPLR